MKPTSNLSRRQFIATTAAAIAAPNFIPASALGRGGAIAPSERTVVGIVGWGMMGPGNTKGLMNEKDCQVVAACDLDKRPLKLAVDTINHSKDYMAGRKLIAERARMNLDKLADPAVLLKEAI